MNKKLLASLLLTVVCLLVFPSSLDAATLKFSPDSHTLNPNSNSSVDLFLETTGEQIIGVDLIIKYDAGLIELSEVFDYGVFSYKSKEIKDNSAGSLKLAFSNDFEKYLSGNQTKIVTLYYKTKSTTGKAGFTFVFEKNKTNDTNVVNSEGTDVLVSVNNTTININSSANKDEVASNPESVAGSSKNVNASAPTKVALRPNEAEFVFPNNIDKTPEVLGESDEVEPEIINEAKNYTVYFIVGAILVIICLTLLAIYLIREKTSQPQLTNY